MTNPKFNIFEDALEYAFTQEQENRIKEIIDQKMINVSIEDVKMIITELMPDIDKLIADKVKQHIKEIGQFMAGKNK